MKFKLGCDPEIFLTDKDKNFKSAIDTFGGTKDFPNPLKDLGEGFFVQEDNVALEFNIPPSDSADTFRRNINAVVSYLAGSAAAAWGLYLNQDSAVSFPDSELDDIRALTFGCDPDYNAWTGRRNPRPRATDPNLRTCGGHVHIGIEDRKIDPKEMMRLGRLLDLYLGIPAVVMDTGDLRKMLYGKAGAMRVKPYGMEYRVLSNFWIFNEAHTKWVWDSVDHALHVWEGGVDIPHLEELITTTINSNNRTMASQLIAEHHLMVV